MDVPRRGSRCPHRFLSSRTPPASRAGAVGKREMRSRPSRRSESSLGPQDWTEHCRLIGAVMGTARGRGGCGSSGQPLTQRASGPRGGRAPNPPVRTGGAGAASSGLELGVQFSWTVLAERAGLLSARGSSSQPRPHRARGAELLAGKSMRISAHHAGAFSSFMREAVEVSLVGPRGLMDKASDSGSED